MPASVCAGPYAGEESCTLLVGVPYACEESCTLLVGVPYACEESCTLLVGLPLCARHVRTASRDQFLWRSFPRTVRRPCLEPFGRFPSVLILPCDTGEATTLASPSAVVLFLIRLGPAFCDCVRLCVGACMCSPSPRASAARGSEPRRPAPPRGVPGSRLCLISVVGVSSSGGDPCVYELVTVYEDPWRAQMGG